MPGGGTHRAGQGVREHVSRRSHVRADQDVEKVAPQGELEGESAHSVCSSCWRASAVTLLMARGHRVENVPEVPLVLDDSCEGTTKTSEAIKILKACGAFADVPKESRASRAVKSG